MSKSFFVVSTAAILTFCASAEAATYRLLYKFAGGNNGRSPHGGVILDANGALYGTTTYGGSMGLGTVFKLNPPVAPDTRWTKTTLHVFSGGYGGGAPVYGSLTSDSNGAVYGMTSNGGAAGLGTIYRLTPPIPPEAKWIKTVLYSFKGGSDGYSPTGSLTFGPDGALYGATYAGGGAFSCLGGNNCGVVFKLSPPIPPAVKWTETVIHRFQGSDGYAPYAVKLALDASGALYGTTHAGGAYGHGTVFKLTAPTQPATPWTETVLHNFAGDRKDGAQPRSGVILDGVGALYGTTLIGGYWGAGVVYKLTPPTPPATRWTFTVLRHHRATTSEGGGPYAPPTFGPDGALYGTTTGAGAGSSGLLGSVYKLAPPTPPATQWTISILHAFKGGWDGKEPSFGGLIFDAAGALYGTTMLGGPADAGTIYQIQ